MITLREELASLGHYVNTDDFAAMLLSSVPMWAKGLGSVEDFVVAMVSYPTSSCALLVCIIASKRAVRIG